MGCRSKVNRSSARPGDVVQMEAHGPKEFPRPSAVPGLHLGEDATEIGEFTHRLGVEHVAGDPVEGLNIAQSAAAFLDIRLHHERSVAIPSVAHRPLRLLCRDILRCSSFLAGGPKASMEVSEQCDISGQEPGIEQCRPNCRVLRTLDQAIMNGPRGMSDGQSKVPKKIEHIFDNPESLG